MYEEKIIAVIDYRADGEIIGNLKKLNIHVVTTRKHVNLAEPVNGHPDMTIFQLDSSNIVVCPEEYDYYMEQLGDFNIGVFKGCSILENKYPENIKYNGVLVENFFFHRLNSTDVEILDILSREEIKCVNVRQGYTKCSTVNLGNKGVITSDPGICQAARNEGMDALGISPGFIDLEGYDYGFLGGATGYLDGTLYFTGQIDNHPDREKIMDYLSGGNLDTVFLSKKGLYDLGTIIFLKFRKF